MLETLRPLQEVKSVASESGGKSYRLPPDKENTGWGEELFNPSL